MTEKTKKPAQPVSNPFLTGAPRDERTVKEALGFFGVVLLSIFMCFIICSMLSFESPILRIGMNALVVGIVLLLFFNNASGRGAEGVARGEILLQRQQKGLTFSESERALCYHPAKGFLVGLLGTLPLLIHRHQADHGGRRAAQLAERLSAAERGGRRPGGLHRAERAGLCRDPSAGGSHYDYALCCHGWGGKPGRAAAD